MNKLRGYMNKLTKYMYIIVLLISFAFMAYLCLAVIPFAEKYYFFSEGTSPEQGKVLPYMLMTIPPFVGYTVFIFANRKNIVFIKSLNYPIIICNLFFGTFICLIANGGTILWYAVFTLPIAIIAAIISFILGIVKDVKYFLLIKQSKLP